MNAAARAIWPVAAWRLASVSVLFVTLYAACNQVSHLRGAVGAAVFAWEQRIPFLPWTVVPYLSIFGFFVVSFGIDRDRQALDRYCAALVANLLIAVVCYACVPLRFMFERPVPAGAFGPMFELLHAADLPYNRAPSLHISMLVLLWWRLRPRLSRVGGALLGGWFLLLTTYQHHVIDIPACVAAAGLSLAVGRRVCDHLAGHEPWGAALRTCASSFSVTCAGWSLSGWRGRVDAAALARPCRGP